MRSLRTCRKAGQHAHVGAAEGVDRLVGVAHRHQVPAVPRQGLQQRLLGRVAVLVLVDEHGVVGVPLPLPGRRRAEQPGGDPDDSWPAGLGWVNWATPGALGSRGHLPCRRPGGRHGDPHLPGVRR